MWAFKYWFQIVRRNEELLNNLVLNAKNVPVVGGNGNINRCGA